MEIQSGNAYICGSGATNFTNQSGSVSNCSTSMVEESFATINQMSVIPNPVESVCEVRFVSNTIGIAQFILTDAAGRIILTKEILIDAIGINSTSLYLGGINAGTYIGKLTINNQVSSVMIVKK